MKLNKDTNILIVGLGLLGGSYAEALTKKGYTVNAVTKEQSSVDFALKKGIIKYGTTKLEESIISAADLVIFALYPHVFTEWIEKNQHLLKSGAVITDVTGVKGCIVYKIQEILRPDVEFIAAHPMAGREVCGVENSDSGIFRGANYIVVPTEKNTAGAIELCRDLGEKLGFHRVAELSVEKHDEMIAFTSQMAHLVSNAYIKSPTARAHKGFSAGSYKDMTRVAWLNAPMWSELFLENRDNMLHELDCLMDRLMEYRAAIAEDDAAALTQLLEDGKKRKEEVDGR